MDYYKYLSNIYGVNHYEADHGFRDILRFFMGREPELSDLGRYVGTTLYEAADYVDKVANPRLITWSINGKRVDRVWLSPVERMVLNELIKRYGVIRVAYRGGDWLDHYSSLYLISDPGIACIITVTNQTAYAIYKYGEHEVQSYFPGLIGEAKEILFGATWFTEIQGGSDLGSNETKAWLEGDTWLLDGDKKYFASNAGLADLALVSARPEGAGPGAKALALFLVPRLWDGELNYLVRRLKWKSATVSVPTGEVEFRRTKAYLIGDTRDGIYYIMENLMLARLANSVGAMGISAKAWLESRVYTSIREAFGKKLIEHPLVQRDLYVMELYLRAGTVLTFKAIHQFNNARDSKPPYDMDYHYARLLTHIVKNYTADYSAEVTKLAMEIHGGIGFLSEFPIERWHREALITPIWEGTSNIHSLDMLEAMAKKNAHIGLINDLEEMAGGESGYIAKARNKILELIDKANKLDNYMVQIYSKDMLKDLGDCLASILLGVMGGELGKEEYIDMGEALYRHRIEGQRIYSVIEKRRLESLVSDPLPPE